MAKESMKAREVKRAKLAAKYAAKREALKAAGDYEGLQKLWMIWAIVQYFCREQSSPIQASDEFRIRHVSRLL